ncbi:MAG: hypothetical protein K9N09_00585 [Candidatus Cloacimonetes bacterium]|nr:hypothetical protein [Candidatus Cloacimonadota bacterium]MCF7813674.1 hypothetical protein [Candidatus Cloacimonadota bacterium]MCF7867170.1 hypothetical protein [Candidatus Cloacimonadota bacterium]MCF7882510.1 hypothetical protein [Candidatus Cloacimonadota bacterium]
MKKILLFSFLVICIALQAANLEFDKEYTELALYNKNNHKIYTYFVVEPGKSIGLKASGVESMDIISRVMLPDKKVEYDYNLEIGDSRERIRKNAKSSSVTKGISGEQVSTYNKVSLSLKNLTKQIKITNISKYKLLFKFNADIANQSNHEIEYVHFSPQIYGDEEVLLVGKNEYTYYTLDEEGIQLSLEGPVVLKVISRYIFDSNFINSNNYRFSVFDNGDMISKYTEEAHKSAKSLLKNDKTKIPSTGDVNILKFGAGMHDIVIKNGSVNRDMIFRLYISKSSIEVDEE